MTVDITTFLAAAVAKILAPLVKILIRQGVAYGTFAEWVRKSYVDVAFAELKESNKKATITSVSAMTGLTRKETKRLNELNMVDMPIVSQRYNRAIRVISGWLEDSRFHNGVGELKKIPIEAANEASFSDLVKDYSGDMTTVAMLDLLKSADCISVDGDEVSLVKHAYIPQGAESSAEKINILGTDVSELLGTIAHNLNAPKDKLLFQRKVSNHSLDPSEVENFKRYSTQRSQALLEDLHHWLVQREVGEGGENVEHSGQYVAVGIYYTEGQK
jgi:hypothetical protein